MFVRDQKGTIAVTAAIGGLVMVAAVGIAIDASRLVTDKHTLQAVADAAALSAASPQGLSDSEREEIAQGAVDEYLAQSGKSLNIDPAKTTVRKGGTEVAVLLTTRTDLIFGGVVGMDSQDVSASALAREYTESVGAGDVAVSFVIDLSESMNDQLDDVSRLSAVKAATTQLLAALAAMGDVNSGVYPFNWGAVDGSTVELTTETNDVLQSISYLQTGEGAVSSASIEQAVDDQIALGVGERVIFYLTDSEVDYQRGDRDGELLPQGALFDVDDRQCFNAADNLKQIEASLRIDQGNMNSSEGVSGPNVPGAIPVLAVGPDILTNSPVPGIGGTVLDPLNLSELELEIAMADSKHEGHDHANELAKKWAKQIERRESFIETCRPSQTVRVVEACEKARENNITIMAVNLSGNDGESTNIVDMCLNGIDATGQGDGQDNGEGGEGGAAGAGTTTEPLSPGSRLTVTVSEDGTSRSASVTTAAELSEFLQSVLPETGRTERSVRLVR